MANENKSWSLSGLKLPREEMIEAINGAATVPAACKAMLVEMVNDFTPEARFLHLNAHCQVVRTAKGAVLDSLHISLAKL